MSFLNNQSSIDVTVPLLPEPEKMGPNLYKFTHDEDQFKFGCIALYNTRRENAFYSITACVGD